MDKNQTQTLGSMKPEDLRNLLAWDTDRQWGNQVQIFLNPGHALLVLREQVAVNVGAPDGEPQMAARNVSSWIMPLDVAEQFAKALIELDFEAMKNGEPDS